MTQEEKEEPYKRWKYRLSQNVHYPLGNEPFVIARTKEEAIEKIIEKEGKRSIEFARRNNFGRPYYELWWTNFA